MGLIPQVLNPKAMVGPLHYSAHNSSKVCDFNLCFPGLVVPPFLPPPGRLEAIFLSQAGSDDARGVDETLAKYPSKSG